ncbi:hypothetical protein [Streptomyces shenzhenensis]|uniref:hypothetical protein n=1 Tax=Streptomyces shenzhenensis TaxID=943815 RepID=UPI00215DA81D|nr:hypothetical protein [Streptomyces shenzhenensis]
MIEVKPGGGYPEWLRATYPGLPGFAKTALKKEWRLGRDIGALRFEFDERDPRPCAP